MGKGGGLFSLSGICSFLGDVQAAADYARQSVEIYHALGKPRPLIGSLLALGHAEKDLGHLEIACQHYEEGINALRIGGAPSTLINGLYGWAEAQIMMKQYDQARELLSEALHLARAAKLPFRICEVTTDLVMLLTRTGQLDSAVEYLEECVTQAQLLKTARYDLMALGAAVVLWHGLGKAEQAALWAGLIAGRPEYIDKMKVFDQICRQLEAALGTSRYRELQEQGKTLTLEAALNEARRLIGV